MTGGHGSDSNSELNRSVDFVVKGQRGTMTSDNSAKFVTTNLQIPTRMFRNNVV